MPSVLLSLLTDHSINKYVNKHYISHLKKWNHSLTLNIPSYYPISLLPLQQSKTPRKIQPFLRPWNTSFSWLSQWSFGLLCYSSSPARPLVMAKSQFLELFSSDIYTPQEFSRSLMALNTIYTVSTSKFTFLAQNFPLYSTYMSNFLLGVSTWLSSKNLKIDMSKIKFLISPPYLYQISSSRIISKLQLSKFQFIKLQLYYFRSSGQEL